MDVFKMNKNMEDAIERDCSAGRVKMDQKDEEEAGFGANVALLLVLYCLQGFPIGLADAFPYILQVRVHINRHAARPTASLRGSL